MRQLQVARAVTQSSALKASLSGSILADVTPLILGIEIPGDE